MVESKFNVANNISIFHFILNITLHELLQIIIKDTDVRGITSFMNLFKPANMKPSLFVLPGLSAVPCNYNELSTASLSVANRQPRSEHKA